MEPKKKKGKERFKFILSFLIVLFLCMYVAGKTGYYQNKLANNTLLTNEALILFEKDIAEGKKVDIKDYLKNTKKDYRNIYSKTGYQISNSIDNILNEGVGKLFELLKSLFT